MVERALVVSYHAPQPDRDSGSRRIFHFLELLQRRGWEAAVFAADGAGEVYDVRSLQQRGIAVYDGYVTHIEEVLTAAAYDLVLIAYWPNVERYLPRVRSLSPSTRVLVDSVDLHFVRESRERLRPAAPARARGLTEANGARFTAELNSYASADGVLTVSQKEADLVNDLVWDPHLAWSVPDCEDVPSRTPTFRRRRGIVCIGSFEYAPNVEGLRYLCEEILPRLEPHVLTDHPLWVVGNKLNSDMARLADGFPHVHMVGWVPSVTPYLERARVSVVPLLYGAGTKRKLVQALAAGTPTVSTTVGGEGLGLRHGEHVLLADDPQDFADGVGRLLTDSKLWAGLANAGRQQVQSTNGKRLVERRFVEVVETVMRRTPKRRTVFSRAVSQPRMSREEYERFVDRIRARLPGLLAPRGDVLVVSKGDERLLQLGPHRAGHFPQEDTGRWAGYHPKDSAAAIEHLEALRARGAGVLAFPRTSFWWLEHYEEFADYLGTEYRLVHSDNDCRIFDLTSNGVEGERAPNGNPPVHVSERPHERIESDDGDVRLIAFYLPQFHPIPENDAWWGRGFTEWRNVAAARPQFQGHYQPHVPGELGFYDLRLPETRAHQAELARSAGIHGFCYYHYWFNSKRLLERPFDEVLSSGEPDFPFALCWANDPWSRRWDGRTDDLLQAQTYGADDDSVHIRSLIPALADPRAIHVDGKPMFLVYRASHLPAPERTCDAWRREIDRAGLSGIHLVAVETAWELGWDATAVGFDAKVLFQPQFGWLITNVSKLRGGRANLPGKDELQLYDYDVVVKAVEDLESVDYRRYECVFPAWDNTPRVGERAVVVHNSTPAAYEAWLRAAVDRARLQPPEHRIVFLNAWNEWAEGCHLEPDLRHGRAYLDATRRAVTPMAAARMSSDCQEPAELAEQLAQLVPSGTLAEREGT
jgi:glycosyltransferase involved in cell wall biosynthesis